MAILMTGLCEKGVNLIWKQCNEALFSEGLQYLNEAVRAGDPEALFFLGYCYSWGDAAVGFNDKKAYECYKEGARSGSYRCVLGALRTGQYDEELKEAARYTPEESYQKVLEAAKRGEAFAAYQIGEGYEWETIFDLIPEEGKKENCLSWYEKAAKGGIVEAMVKLGKCYLNGRFTEKDPEKVLHYADLAAACGDVWGLYRMGVHHYEEKNEEAAFAYFYAASSQGDKKSPYYMGKMYRSGAGTERSIELAIEAFETAAFRGETECLIELGDLFYRDELIERDDEKAFYWYNRAYEAGECRAAFPLGKLYLRSPKFHDYEKAEKLLREAADKVTDGTVQLALGNMCREGLCHKPDMEQAVAFYEAGAGVENAECMELLGTLYFQGEVIEQDYEKAFYWLDQCLKKGTIQSYSKLAFLYLKGYGCEPDEEKAIELFEKGADTECDGYAMYELGYIYERRNESQEDLEAAVQYYECAIEMGNESAKRRFSHFKKTLFGKWKVVY